MTPRAYRIGERRRTGTQATRAKIVAAARDLLGGSSAAAFSIDAVARCAGVARMTVYYQFKSKAKVLEAVFDNLATRAEMQHMRDVFREPDPAKGLLKLVEVFCHLWESEGALVSRITGLAALDPEVDAALAERSGWRREALEEIVRRLHPRDSPDDAIDVLFAITSFETYRALSTGREPKAIVSLLQRTALALSKQS